MQSGKKNKRHKDQKRSITVFIHRQHNCLQRKLKGIYKSTKSHSELIGEYNNIAGYKGNIQKYQLNF